MSRLMIGGLMMSLAVLAIFAMPAEAVVYSFTPQNTYAAANYPDEGGVTLTDGILGTQGGNGWTDPAEVGWISGTGGAFPLLTSVTISIDLGANTDIGGVRGYFYSNGGVNNMKYPVEVAVSTSTDNVNFSTPVSVFPVDTTIAWGNARTWIEVELPTLETVRYVKMECFLWLNGSDGWLFLSEVEVLAPTALQSFNALEARVTAIEDANLQSQIDDLSADLEDLLNHVHDKGSGGRMTSGPIFP